MFKQVEDVVQESLSILDNPYAKNIIKMFLVLYAGLAAPRLPAFHAGLFNNALFRIVVLFLIAYLGLKDTTIALFFGKSTPAILAKLDLLNLNINPVFVYVLGFHK